MPPRSAPDRPVPAAWRGSRPTRRAGVALHPIDHLAARSHLDLGARRGAAGDHRAAVAIDPDDVEAGPGLGLGRRARRRRQRATRRLRHSVAPSSSVRPAAGGSCAGASCCDAGSPQPRRARARVGLWRGAPRSQASRLPRPRPRAGSVASVDSGAGSAVAAAGSPTGSGGGACCGAGDVAARSCPAVAQDRAAPRPPAPRRVGCPAPRCSASARSASGCSGAGRSATASGAGACPSSPSWSNSAGRGQRQP